MHIKSEKTPGSQSNPEQNKQCLKNSFPDLKMYYRAIVIKALWLTSTKQTNATK